MNIGKLFKEKRLSSNLTLKRVSSITGISIRHLQYLEANKRNPSLKLISVLCKLYSIDNLPVS